MNPGKWHDPENGMAQYTRDPETNITPWKWMLGMAIPKELSGSPAAFTAPVRLLEISQSYENGMYIYPNN